MGRSRALVMAVGLLIAVAAPSVRDAIQRDRQKRTMRDMRTLATAMESYTIDNMAYVVVDPKDLAALDMLAASLVPTYVKVLPRRDAWGRDFHVQATTLEYTVTSFGSDGRPDVPARSPATATGETTDFRDDIVFDTGSFVKYPCGGPY